MADTKTAFCNAMSELSINEWYELIIEYLDGRKTSDKVGSFLISLM